MLNKVNEEAKHQQMQPDRLVIKSLKRTMQVLTSSSNSKDKGHTSTPVNPKP